MNNNNYNSFFSTKNQSLYISSELDKESGHSPYNSNVNVSSRNMKIVQSMAPYSEESSLNFLNNAYFINDDKEDSVKGISLFEKMENNPIFDNKIKSKYINYIIFYHLIEDMPFNLPEFKGEKHMDKDNSQAEKLNKWEEKLNARQLKMEEEMKAWKMKMEEEIKKKMEEDIKKKMEEEMNAWKMKMEEEMLAWRKKIQEEMKNKMEEELSTKLKKMQEEMKKKGKDLTEKSTGTHQCLENANCDDEEVMP